MSDKKIDIDNLFNEDNDDISDNGEKKQQKISSEEIDELLASVKKKKIMSEINTDDVVEGVIDDAAPDAADEMESGEEAVPVIGEEKRLPDEEKKDSELKKHFGKNSDDEEAEEEDDDEDKPNKTPVRKENEKHTSATKKRKKRSKKGRKKKGAIGFNGSIFGGIILVTIILTVSMLLAVGGLTMGMEFYGIGKDENDISFNIPEGSTNKEIADLLFENGIIKNKDLFMMAVKIVKPKNIYPGDITLKPSTPYLEIIKKMEEQRERYETVTLTFIEGSYLVDIADQLEQANVCSADEFLFEFKQDLGYKFESYITGNENAFYPKEGYCFPDTYEFYVGDTAYNITKILREHFDSKITDSMYTKMNSMGLTLNDTMTLASIVQLEAANVDEMPRIASVFLNRLKDPDTFPMLQTDTTYKYIDQVIKKKAGNDEMADHYIEYYDTYAIDGLPAGPICNPGIDAINAVLNPEKTNYYYFCNNLETGETFYAETLEEHEANQIKAGLIEAVENDEDTEEDNGEEYNEYY